MMRIVTVEQMQELEQRADAAGHSYSAMMEQAGKAVALAIAQQHKPKGLRVLVLVGPGNNGGDGLVCARYLRQMDANVALYIWKRNATGDENWAKAQALGIHMTLKADDPDWAKLKHYVSKADIIVDALLGTGVTRPIEGELEHLIEITQHLVRQRRDGKAPTLCDATAPPPPQPALPQIAAVDVPSGVNCDTGQVDPVTMPADLTVTFGVPKIGQFRFPAASVLGKLVIADIGLDPALSDDIPTSLMTAADVSQVLPQRPLDAHKGSFGQAMIVAGSTNYVGAAYLASAAATRVGAGLVTLAASHTLQPMLAAKLTETTYLPLPDERGALVADGLKLLQAQMEDYAALLVGPGLGQHPRTMQMVRQLLGVDEALAHRMGFLAPGQDAGEHRGTLPQKLVIDADGLNALAAMPNWWRNLPTAILTPHPGEMSRLLDRPIAEINQHRLEIARDAARDWNQTVVLKGAFTVVAAPDGRIALSPFANPGLASAGTGDVLAGAITGLLAQGLEPFEAAMAGVYLHGLAGEMASKEVGPVGMVASDLLPRLPGAWASLGTT